MTLDERHRVHAAFRRAYTGPYPSRMTLDERLRLHDQPYELGEKSCDLCALDSRKRARRIMALLCFSACVTLWAWAVAE